MSVATEYHPRRMPGTLALFSGAAALTAALSTLYFALGGPVPLTNPGLGDLPYFLLIALHYLWGATMILVRPRLDRKRIRWFVVAADALAAYTLLLFLFAWIFALNANMDYVQRFVEAGGDLRLALDTRTERAIAALRFGPFLLVNALFSLLIRVRRSALVRATAPPAMIESSDPTAAYLRPFASWGLLLTLVSVLLSTLSFPSFVHLDGIGPLGFISLVPLLLAIRGSSYRRGLFLGVAYGTFTTLLVNFWLGTFSLVSLQISVLIFFCFYLLFMLPTLWFYRRIRVARFLVFPLAWTFFELARSSGFLGYPWALVGHSQYRVLPLIQLSTITGVWGVSFLVLLVNSALAELAVHLLVRRREPVREPVAGMPRTAVRPTQAPVATARVPLATAAALLLLVFAGGSLALGIGRTDSGGGDAAARTDARTVRIALIQQNSDPRKHDYDQTFEALRRLTDQSLVHNPDIVAWSETAFVPNIRRWGEENPRFNPFARLVHEFRAYQASIETWLLTGNDDYARVFDENNREIERHHFNAAVLFSDTGERTQTYHKIRLVPFTEHFPYEHIFPRIHQLLQDFDVYFWEPGEERVVFEHPLFRFSTPICFEDVFPNEVRQFVTAGAEVILNISNDYWSLTEVQAQQHFAAGMFRAVENRRPLVRSTASGLTAHVDEYGRVLATLPQYQEAYLIADVVIPGRLRTTIYTRFGDWFPVACLLALIGLTLFSAVPGRKARPRINSRREQSPQPADSGAAAPGPGLPVDPS
ncbi:MAG: apolipoprotein N-acyltransferase [Spirochaetaceae bacterium]|nr:MAG: apolipoprotein N-acyltransferase [Spirochaetaceae bacterium]